MRGLSRQVVFHGSGLSRQVSLYGLSSRWSLVTAGSVALKCKIFLPGICGLSRKLVSHGSGLTIKPDFTLQLLTSNIALCIMVDFCALMGIPSLISHLLQCQLDLALRKNSTQDFAILGCLGFWTLKGYNNYIFQRKKQNYQNEL